MKILHVNTTIDRGGAAQVSKTIHDHLNSINGFESFFAYGRGNIIRGKNTFKFSLFPEVLLNFIITRVTGLTGYGTFFSTRRLKAFIKKNKFDIIHIHNIHGYYIDLSFIKFLKKTGIKVVWTLHDVWALTGRCSSLALCNDKWVSGCFDCKDKNIYPKTFMDSSRLMWSIKKKLFREMSNFTLVAPSLWLKDQVKHSYLKKMKIKVIHNAVDTKIFKPMDKAEVRGKYKIQKERKVVLFIAGNLNNRQKGFEYFINAANRLKNNDLLLIAVGKKYGNKLFCRHEIMFIDIISDKKKLAEIYNVSDIYCTTSLDEVFGLTVTEAMACGVPIAGFRTGGVIEQVGNNCGILSKQKDTVTLARNIGKLLGDKKKHMKYSSNCLIRAKTEYSSNAFFKKYISLYKNICSVSRVIK